jgi:hypothetical protein
MSKREKHVHQTAAVPDSPTGNDHNTPTMVRDEIAQLAFELWQRRGCPVGSPEEDWVQAETTIRQSHQ